MDPNFEMVCVSVVGMEQDPSYPHYSHLYRLINAIETSTEDTLTHDERKQLLVFIHNEFNRLNEHGDVDNTEYYSFYDLDEESCLFVPIGTGNENFVLARKFSIFLEKIGFISLVEMHDNKYFWC